MTSLNLIRIATASSGLTTSTTAYTADDVLGAEMQFDMGSNSYGIIIGAAIHDKSDVIGAVDLFLSTDSITFGSDNAAPSISDADNFKLQGVIQFPTAYDLGGNRFAAVDSLAIPVFATASGIIYGRMVTRTGHTFFGAATDIQVDLIISNDL